MTGSKLFPVFIEDRHDRYLATIISVADPYIFVPNQWFKPWPQPLSCTCTCAHPYIRTHVQSSVSPVCPSPKRPDPYRYMDFFWVFFSI